MPLAYATLTHNCMPLTPLAFNLNHTPLTATPAVHIHVPAHTSHVASKPGSIDGIHQVVNSAAANPDLAIIMQRTGGHAGGHRSTHYRNLLKYAPP